MEHEMKLVPWAFDAMYAGTKTIEMRLFDQKRSKIKVGDNIKFKNTASGKTMLCNVTKLTKFKSFEELYAAYDKTALGYQKNEPSNPKDMSKFYDQKEIEQLGVLAIEVKKIN